MIKPDNCPCSLCKVYIESVGFLSNISKAYDFFKKFLCHIFILLSDLCILFHCKIIYKNCSKTLNILSFILIFFMFSRLFT